MSQAPHVLVTFARPEESSAFRRRLAGRQSTRTAADLPLVTGMVGPQDVVVAHTGIGPAAAAKSARALLLRGGPWHSVIAAGFAGGLDPRLRLGDIVTQEFPSSLPPTLISRPLPVERAAEKSALHQESAAHAVDMETASIATICHEAGVPMIAIRAISDTAGSDLPVPFASWFDLERQRPKPFALLTFLIRNPGRIPPFIQFIRNLRPAREALASAIETHIRALPPL